MEKKRPKGVIIVSIYAVLSSLLYLRHFSIANREDFLTSIVGLCWLISAIALFMLINWGRLMVILLAAYDIFDDIYFMSMSFYNEVEKWMVEVPIFTRTQSSIIVVAIVVFALLINSLVLLYLTRPKVKEQFK